MILTTWPEIMKYLNLSRYKIMSLGYPVYILPNSGAVYAESKILDLHTAHLLRSGKPAGTKKPPEGG